MPVEIQVSDMLSRVIERSRPQVEVVSSRLVFDLHDQDRIVRNEDGQATIYPATTVRKEGFFRRHSIPNAARWVRNPNPRNLFEIIVKRQIVYTPQES